MGNNPASYMLMLVEHDENRYVPILIGEQEAQGIIMAAEGRKARRPMPHDLLVDLCDQFDIKITRITIDRFEEGIFYASIHAKDSFAEHRIDSRTSDAVLLAMKTDTLILVAESVLEEAGVSVEQLTQNTDDMSPERQRAMLEDLLREAEEREDYERAAEIQKQLDDLNNDNSQ